MKDRQIELSYLLAHSSNAHNSQCRAGLKLEPTPPAWSPCGRQGPQHQNRYLLPPGCALGSWIKSRVAST